MTTIFVLQALVFGLGWGGGSFVRGPSKLANKKDADHYQVFFFDRSFIFKNMQFLHQFYFQAQLIAS